MPRGNGPLPTARPAARPLPPMPLENPRKTPKTPEHSHTTSPSSGNVTRRHSTRRKEGYRSSCVVCPSRRGRNTSGGWSRGSRLTIRMVSGAFQSTSCLDAGEASRNTDQKPFLLFFPRFLARCARPARRIAKDTTSTHIISLPTASEAHRFVRAVHNRRYGGHLFDRDYVMRAEVVW